MIRVREIAASDAREIRLRLVLDHCKWDPQVGDQNTLPPYALVMDRFAWSELEATTETLARELARVEHALGSRADFDDTLGVPRALRAMIRAPLDPTPALARVMRFDFHPTHDGWALSEINADVPGGFTEASHLPRLAGEALGLDGVGDPARAFVDAMVARVAEGDVVAFVCAPGFMEDAQVVTLLARELEARGRRGILGNAKSLSWRDGHARMRDADVAGIVRFYQAEWIAEMRGSIPLFSGGKTPVTNPACAAVAESKRLPLVLDGLGAPSLHAAFPETRDARDVAWRSSPDAWVLKGTYSNTGDRVIFPERLGRAARALLAMRTFARPDDWVAQRRFESAPIDSPDGPLHACVGVYVVDGNVAGAYARVSHHAIIDFRAMDVALLLD